MALDPLMIGDFRAAQARFTINHSTRPLMLAMAGEKGSRVHAINGTSSLASSIQMMYGHRMTKQTDAGVLAATPGANTSTSDTITRTTGSFITDGWKVDDSIVVHHPAPTGNVANLIHAQVQSVTATVLTLYIPASTRTNGRFAAAETFTGVAELYRVTELAVTSLPVNSGVNADTVSVDLLASTKPFVDASPDRFMTLGKNAALFGFLPIAMTGINSASVTTFLGDY